MNDPRMLARPDFWALRLNLRVDGRPFNLDGREYLPQVMRDTSPKIVVKKAAQTAFTISFITTTLQRIVERGWHHLYLLPLKTGAVPFVQSRIDPIIESSPYLKAHFRSVDNRLHKQTSNDIKLLIRGTNVESELQETPVDCVIFDEYDRMVTDWLQDAKYRTSGSRVKKLTYLSTPSVPGHGIDSEEMWHASDQHHWEIPCPRCGRFQFLDWQENLRVGDTPQDCALECRYCSKALTDEIRPGLNAKGRWTPHNLNGVSRGYHINQFCSPTMTLPEIMEAFFNGQDDPKVLKSFFNQSLGLPYAALGDRLTIQLLDACRETGWHGGGIPNGPVYIGVDVGHDVLYVKSSFIDRKGKRRFWQMRKFVDTPRDNAFRQLERWLNKLSTFCCVVDAHPDKREASELSRKYPGKVWLGFEKDRPEQQDTAVFSKAIRGEPNKVVIDRTMAFDATTAQYINGEVVLTIDARELGEIMQRRDYNGFYSAMIQQVRVEEEDSKGRIVARWQKNKTPDHWHHADMFEWVATLKRPPMRIPPNVGRAMKDAGSLIGG